MGVACILGLQQPLFFHRSSPISCKKDRTIEDMGLAATKSLQHVGHNSVIVLACSCMEGAKPGALQLLNSSLSLPSSSSTHKPSWGPLTPDWSLLLLLLPATLAT